jgi:TonB family protein
LPLNANLFTVARVNPIVVVRRAGVFLLIFITLAPALVAQSLLLVKHGDKSLVVRAAHGLNPCVEIDGKITSLSENRFALLPVEEYLPIFIAVRNLTVNTHALNLIGSGSTINHELNFKASFEAPYRLDDVFLLLDMDMEKGGRVFFLWGLDRLEPRDLKSVSLTVPLAYELGSGHFQFHLFVGGAEVLHSEMPFNYREAALDRMVRKRIASVERAAPKPFVGPMPEYPPKFWKKKISGKAMISVRIAPNGMTLDPSVTSASDPAFGETALTAIRLWRFLPKIEAGRPVESHVSIPFVFDAPSAAGHKKS